MKKNLIYVNTHTVADQLDCILCFIHRHGCDNRQFFFYCDRLNFEKISQKTPRNTKEIAREKNNIIPTNCTTEKVWQIWLTFCQFTLCTVFNMFIFLCFIDFEKYIQSSSSALKYWKVSIRWLMICVKYIYFRFKKKTRERKREANRTHPLPCFIFPINVVDSIFRYVSTNTITFCWFLCCVCV